jgi:hypothetical protein
LILFLLKDFCNIYFRHAIPSEGFCKIYFRHAILSEGFWKMQNDARRVGKRLDHSSSHIFSVSANDFSFSRASPIGSKRTYSLPEQRPAGCVLILQGKNAERFLKGAAPVEGSPAVSPVKYF